ncbi:hypothetical protein M2413_005576 [Pseudomonas putida]|nr:hypothetical protein [Pseudomonas putida]
MSCADAGYTGVEKRPEHEGRQVIWQVAARAKLVLNTLRGLLFKAENGKIHAPMEARDIPGYRYLPETNLQHDRNLSQLFAEFYMALIEEEE